MLIVMGNLLGFDYVILVFIIEPKREFLFKTTKVYYDGVR